METKCYHWQQNLVAEELSYVHCYNFNFNKNRSKILTKLSMAATPHDDRRLDIDGTDIHRPMRGSNLSTELW